jgi:hypothetical protein
MGVMLAWFPLLVFACDGHDDFDANIYSIFIFRIRDPYTFQVIYKKILKVA